MCVCIVANIMLQQLWRAAFSALVYCSEVLECEPHEKAEEDYPLVRWLCGQNDYALSENFSGVSWRNIFFPMTAAVSSLCRGGFEGDDRQGRRHIWQMWHCFYDLTFRKSLQWAYCVKRTFKPIFFFWFIFLVGSFCKRSNVKFSWFNCYKNAFHCTCIEQVPCKLILRLWYAWSNKTNENWHGWWGKYVRISVLLR